MFINSPKTKSTEYHYRLYANEVFQKATSAAAEKCIKCTYRKINEEQITQNKAKYSFCIH